MEFIKEESKDMKIEEAFRVKHEDTEEQTEDVCRKKWKSLRDTYLKEKRKEMEKRSGSAAGSVKKCKYSQILGFLDPFVTPRKTTSNMVGVEAQANRGGEAPGVPVMVLSEVEQTLLELLRGPPAPPPPPSADEHFFLSLLPFLQSMPSHTKEIIKFQMYKLAMENSTVVLNLEQLDPHSPQ
ncbi:hypothetical protein cypCar_00026296 [Cyprinus carpio]|nr:hypothetical protein cypCar_00026296 [Cyprinus carpio]